MRLEELILSLYDIGAIKFGQYKLKSGLISPFYIDLRLTVSYPELLKAVADRMWEQVSHLSFSTVCGVPYTALPIATCMSIAHNKPMILRRREAKAHGTGNILEGVIRPGETCLVVEDLITSGASIFETINPIQQAGMHVEHIVVFLDRQQGGRQVVEARGHRLHAVTTIEELFQILKQHGKVSDETIQRCFAFIQQNQVQESICPV
jgi:uridine monophosphate synthetase